MTDSIDIRRLRSRRPQPAGPGDQRPPDAGRVQPANEGGAGGGIWAFLNKDIRLFGNGLPDKIKESFYLELSVLLSAGIDIRAALDLIKSEQPKKKHQQIFDNIVRQIVAGSTLSSAMKNNGLFSPYEYYSVQIGEETGKLIVVLNELATYYKKKIDQQRQIVSALTYPVLVMVVAGGAVGFMMAYVVPMFADVLKRFGGDLPLITKMVMRLSALIRQSGGIFLLLVTATTIFILSQKKQRWFRKYSSALILRIPVVGDLIRKIYLSRFSNTMSLLIGSHIPMLQSIEMVSQMVSFYPIESTLPDVAAKVMSGQPLHKSLGDHSVYPTKMISLIKVGEEVNQLDLFFNKVSTQYSGEVEYRTTLLSKFLEPMIIVVLGLVVGVILIAMYLPLFKLGQAV
jgi:type IV pilus assembly protein PilC